MKQFLRHELSIEDCREELAKFQSLLASKEELKERDDILPFFRENLNLSAFVATYIPGLNPDLIALEYELFSDFACDLVVGDSISKTFAFVEFEDAKKESLFVQKQGKVTPEWAPRLEHGFSQVIDWLYKLNDMERTEDFENRFGARSVTIHGLLIVGRDQQLQQREQSRLRWRQDHTVINSKKVSIFTFDELARDIAYRLDRYPEAAEADESST